MSDEIELHPVQVHTHPHYRAQVSSLVTRRAYEVYCELYGEQPAMMDLKGRDCRGGFGVIELFGFLYARSFPKDQWRARFEEACKGARGV